MRAAAVVLAVCAALFFTGCEKTPRRAPEARSPSDTTAGSPPPNAPAALDATEPDSLVASALVRAYYRAIAERRFLDAYRLWASNGAASGRSFEQFENGFANTATVDVEVGAPGPMGAAAGSRYIDVPVRIHARLRDGTRQEFTGAYTLRRSVVDGATAEQRAWRIHSAAVRAAKP